MARSIKYSTSTPCSLQVGMSFHDMVLVTLLLYCMRSLSNTQSGRTWPARHLQVLRRIVDVRLRVIADKLSRRFAARLVRQIGELRAGLLLEEDGENVVFALGSGAAHLEVGARLLGRVGEFLHRLVGMLG